MLQPFTAFRFFWKYQIKLSIDSYITGFSRVSPQKNN